MFSTILTNVFVSKFLDTPDSRKGTTICMHGSIPPEGEEGG
jgi:hypothetical protein